MSRLDFCSGVSGIVVDCVLLQAIASLFSAVSELSPGLDPVQSSGGRIDTVQKVAGTLRVPKPDADSTGSVPATLVNLSLPFALFQRCRHFQQVNRR